MSAEANGVDRYLQEQMEAIQAWTSKPPSVVNQALAYAFMPVAWAVRRVVPPLAIEGALKGTDWLAQQTLFKERLFRDAGVSSFDELNRLHLKELDIVASGFHLWAVGYAVVEGAAVGAVGLPGIAVDIPAVVAMALRTVRGIGICYGYIPDGEPERQFVLGILSAAGANSMAEKNTALLFLRQMEVTLVRQTFKRMAAKAATQPLTKEAAILALRNLARQLGVNLTKRKMMQAIPLVGGVVGAAVNGTFIDDIAWAARRAYQQRWLADRGYVLRLQC